MDPSAAESIAGNSAKEAAMIRNLDHVNIVTKNFPETLRFYTEVRGTESG